MTKQELIYKISHAKGIKQRVVSKVVESFLVNIQSEVSTGGKVEIRGFGCFKLRRAKAKKGRNIVAGTEVLIPERNVPVFRAYDGFIYDKI